MTDFRVRSCANTAGRLLATAMLSKSLWGRRNRRQMVKYSGMTRDSPNLNTDDGIVHILVCTVHAQASRVLYKQIRLWLATYQRYKKKPYQTHSRASCAKDKVQRGGDNSHHYIIAIKKVWWQQFHVSYFNHRGAAQVWTNVIWHSIQSNVFECMNSSLQWMFEFGIKN